MLKRKQNTALMQKVLVFDDKVHIGHGYIYYRDDGKISNPELYATDGEKLKEGWYKVVSTDVTSLVVIARSKM